MGDFRKFKQGKVAPLLKCIGEWDASSKVDSVIRFVFSTDREVNDLLRMQLTNVKQWLHFAARETLTTVSYNAFKHGVGLIIGQGDAMISLASSKDEKGSRRWSRHTK